MSQNSSVMQLPQFVPWVLTSDTAQPVEVGMITPPFGLNIFVINAMARNVSMADTYRGVLPFVASDVVRILIILFVPWTALWAPGLWYG